MDFLQKYTTGKLILITVVSTIFVIYPNLACIPWELDLAKEDHQRTCLLMYNAFRYLFFCGLIFTLLKLNLQKFNMQAFNKRFLYNALINLAGYIIFVGLTFTFYPKATHMGSMLVFQFVFICFVVTFTGHTYLLSTVQRNKEQEIEKLKMENLQSRYDALMNQINPHFFFNSLNGLTALIRKKNDENTLTYVNKMSDVFRYILQSDKKGLVTLEEELEFVDAFFYMMEIRFANKLQFNVDVGTDHMNYKLPVLSILPLIENVVVHNKIDSEHKMNVSIRMNEQNELMVANPLYPKLSPPETNGTGLRNLENRFQLLMGKQIRIVQTHDMFCVYLPLII